jgi:PhnB protein
MILNPYINFRGNCAEAFRFYEQQLRGQITMMMTHGEAPGGSPAPKEWHDRVLHARITIGGTELLAADIPDAQPMRSAYLSLTVDSVEEAERVYAALREGGETFMPMEETFFAERFAMLRDRFGASWMLMKPKPQQ